MDKSTYQSINSLFNKFLTKCLQLKTVLNSRD